MSLEEQIKAEERRIFDKIEANRKAETKLTEKIIKVDREKVEATKELERQMKEIEKPYDHKISELKRKREQLEHSRYALERLRNTAEARLSFRADKSGEFSSAESFRGFMFSKKINLCEVVKIEKKLPNGITLFRHSDGQASEASAVAYFAVRGRNIVGFHFTRKAEHKGDEPDYYAWIDVGLLRDGNRKFDNFTTWKEKIGWSPPEFVPIDLNNEKNKAVMRSTWSIHSEDIGRE